MPPLPVSALDSLRHGRNDEVRAALQELCNVPAHATVISWVGDRDEDRPAVPLRSRTARG